MDPILLADDYSFWDVIWWMIMVFFAVMIIWMFIALFADIFRRDDLSGWAKAGWLFLLFILPFLGALLYLIFRPAVTPSDVRMAEAARRMAVGSSAEEIAKAQQLLQSGAITQAEFDELKRRALA
jgi:uncharacterized membrane protein